MSLGSSRQRGFSLLELLVAFVIMAFALGMLYQASGGTVRTLGETEQHQRAALLAQSILSSREGVPDTGWNEAGESAGLAWQVRSAPYPTGVTDSRAAVLHQINVVVGWTDRRGLRQLEVSTLVPQLSALPGANR
jgi:general secretion pathway protein I